MDHPYCYPGTDVYRNKEGIRNKVELDEFERMATAWRLETVPRGLSITPESYRELHRYLLQDVYEWSGQYRFVDTGRTGPFCKAQFIAAEMVKRFAAINAEDNLRGLDAGSFADRAAEHIGELNAVHPFIEGNGRTVRAFLEILADQAGHSIDLARIDPEAWNAASIVSFHKLDYAPLRGVIAGALETAERQ